MLDLPHSRCTPTSPLLPNHATLTSPTTSTKTSLALGIVFVVVQLLCQQAQNEMLRFQETNTTFSVPIEIIYMNHSWLLWMFVGAWVVGSSKRTTSCCACRTSPVQPLRRFMQHATTKMPLGLLIARIVALEWLMFLPNVAWAMSVKRVSVTLSIATQQSQCVFVYLFSLLCFYHCNSANATTTSSATTTTTNNNNATTTTTNNKTNTSTPNKNSMVKTWSPPFAVFVCLLGIVLVCCGETKGGGAGDGQASNFLLLAINPIFIALFDLVFSAWSSIVCRDTEDVLCLMGCMGIAALTTCWPALFLDDNAFQLPSLFSLEGYLLYGNSLLATLYNVAFMVGISVMGPLFISVGAVLQLPLSALTDLVLYHRTINVEVAFGGLCIMSGFLVLTFLGNHGGNETKMEVASPDRTAGIALDNSGVEEQRVSRVEE